MDPFTTRHPQDSVVSDSLRPGKHSVGDKDPSRSSAPDSDTHYPIHSATGVDLTLLRHNLNLTPTQRWQQNFQALRLVESLRESGRALRACSAAPAGPAQS